MLVVATDETARRRVERKLSTAGLVPRENVRIVLGVEGLTVLRGGDFVKDPEAITERKPEFMTPEECKHAIQ